MENDNQTCDNCKYYSEHYVKLDNGIFMKTSIGHCKNKKHTFNQSIKIIKRQRICELWEPADIIIEGRKCSILNIIAAMEIHLSQIKQILKEDCKHSDAQNNISES